MRLEPGNEKAGCRRFVDHAAPGAPPTQEETFGRALRADDVGHDPRRGEVMETLEFIVGHDERIGF